MINDIKRFVGNREDFDRHLHISHSQLKTYLTCPQKYWFQYVRGLPWEFIPDYLPFGRSIHAAVRVFYQTLQETGGKISPEELIDRFAQSWNQESQGKIRFKEGQDKESLMEKGTQMLHAFYECASPQRILGVEVPFSVDLVQNDTGEVLPYKLAGIFDLIESDHEGTVVIVELKTGSKRFTEDQLDLDLQGTLYSYALDRMGFCTNGGETLVRYDLLLKQKKPAMEPYYAIKGRVHYRWVYQLLKKVIGSIESGIFYPVPGWQCKDCPFGTACGKKE